MFLFENVDTLDCEKEYPWGILREKWHRVRSVWLKCWRCLDVGVGGMYHLKKSGEFSIPLLGSDPISKFSFDLCKDVWIERIQRQYEFLRKLKKWNVESEYPHGIGDLCQHALIVKSVAFIWLVLCKCMSFRQHPPLSHSISVCSKSIFFVECFDPDKQTEATSQVLYPLN